MLTALARERPLQSKKEPLCWTVGLLWLLVSGGVAPCEVAAAAGRSWPGPLDGSTVRAYAVLIRLGRLRCRARRSGHTSAVPAALQASAVVLQLGSSHRLRRHYCRADRAGHRTGLSDLLRRICPAGFGPAVLDSELRRRRLAARRFGYDVCADRPDAGTLGPCLRGAWRGPDLAVTLANRAC